MSLANSYANTIIAADNDAALIAALNDHYKKEKLILNHYSIHDKLFLIQFIDGSLLETIPNKGECLLTIVPPEKCTEYKDGLIEILENALNKRKDKNAG